MDDIQKSKVRLEHWIDHNVDHLNGYEEVAAVLEREGLHAVAVRIRRGIEFVKSANREFEKALEDLAMPGKEEPHHAHEHGHGHGHGHDHDHG